MARYFKADEATKVFRAVITRESGHVDAYGPYTTQGAAKRMVSQETRGGYWRNGTGKVQEATVEWEDCD